MIIRGKPIRPTDYIIVSHKKALYLQKNGFNPLYMDDKKMYFAKTPELLEFMKFKLLRGGLAICKKK